MHDHPDKPKYAVVFQAAKEVASPVTFAVLIIAAVFIPLLSLGGLAGKLYTPMALNIVFVMFASLVVALVLVPVLVLLLLKPTRSAENFFVKGLKKGYRPLLEWALRHSKSVLVGVSVLFGVFAYLISQQGREFMPELNEESIMYRVIAIPSTALSQTIDLSKEIEEHIKSTYSRSVESVLAMIGRSEKGETAQPNYMEVLVILKEGVSDLEELTKRMTEDLQKRFSYVQFVPTQPIAMRIEELLEGVKAELAVKIYGEDQKTLATLAKRIQNAIANVEGLEHIEIESQLGQAQIRIVPDYLALARYGITVGEVMEVIRNGIGEEAITQKIEGVRRFGIVAKIKDAKNDIESLKRVLLRSRSGKLVTLDTLCKVEILQGPSFIKRENLSRYMVLSMDVSGRDVASFVAEASRAIRKNVDFPTGYYFAWAGDFKNMQEATQRLLFIVPVTIFLVILLLYTAFGSIKKALIVFLNVPFGLIGGMVAVLVSGIYLSVSAIIGFLAIFAIAVLNGIVLVSFIEELRKRFGDVDLKTVLKDAALLRLRPVLMTAFTTLFGILPLLYASGVGSEIQYPLAVVITGGIVSSTLLTLLILPSAYLLFYKKEDTMAR